MYVKRNYGFWMTVNWSKRPFIWGTLYATAVCALAYLTDLGVYLPWQPLGVVGIAVAFYLGFKNNSSYDRTWEARKIWGSIVNNSRAFAAAVVAFVKGPDARSIQKELIYRHLAWLTALRHQLRLSKEWEHTRERLEGRYVPTVCEAYLSKLDDDLEPFLAEEEANRYRSASNMAVQILGAQSRRLQELRDAGYFEDFRHMEFHQLVVSLYADQGKSERIKNFPFPRQYASTALWLTSVFCVLVPFGMLEIFSKAPEGVRWFCAPVSGLIIWIFFLMEKIGDYSENPFEGTYNDVPITSIARGIEIDMREMIGDARIPKPVAPDNGFLL